MKSKIKNLVFTLFLNFGLLYAGAPEYQEIYQKEHKEFNKQMREEIKKALSTSSHNVQELYKEIDYQPVWVDKDYLTHFAELLIHELEADFKKGLHQELVSTYRGLLPNKEKIFISDSIEEKVKIELGLMKLYYAYIGAILKENESKHTALSLLKHAIYEQSLIHALNAISDERITHHILSMDHNMTMVKESEKMDMDSIKLLTGSDKEKKLKAMYDLLEFHHIWITKTGFTSFTRTLFNQIESDITLDRNSDTYKRYLQIKEANDDQRKGDIEFEIASLYHDYMSHLLYGDINWKEFQTKLKHKRNADWVVHNVLASPESLLIEAIIHQSLDRAFKEATPSFPLYSKLIGALEKYQGFVNKGGWKKLPEFQDLKPGMSDAVVPALRERLAQEGDYVPCNESNETELYDQCLFEAVQKFQIRHGLASEGYVGKMTRKALNESAEEKVARIKLNLDRMKWIKRSHDRYQIWVNIPDYTMSVFDGEQPIESMKVIVGRKGHHTPVFYNRVRSIVLNPYWRIPPSIIRHEMIPKLKKDRGYTNRKNIEIHTGYSERSPRVNPYKVNWHKYGRKLPPYRFMQSPGKHNALGKIKYLFPNKYSVYMHDTNQPELFSKDVRSLSHGCVRLNKPVDLLETFSKIDPKINFNKGLEILKKNEKTPLRLSKTIPIDIIYLTTWVNDDGEVAFRDDVYGYDKLQILTMK
jgi:murein L,D-transpeptidase YcbB/YkuD